MTKQPRHYQLPQRTYLRLLPNQWDLLSFCIVLAFLTIFVKTAQSMATPYQIGAQLPISLDPHNLPFYASRSILRMGIALIFSLLFTFVFGTLAAKKKWAEKIIIPLIDILQSVPILGFLSITVAWFIALFPGSLLGPECAAIFVIFTSQAWNMAISFYQSLKTVPQEICEAGTMFHLNAWQRFWRIEVPFAAPALLWNTMMSLSGGWFFVTASEAISTAHQSINLPGIGSYIAAAVNQGDIYAILYAILAMLVVILLYDQFIFRPLLSWSERFQAEDSEISGHGSWVIDLLARTHLLKKFGYGFAIFSDHLVNFKPLTKNLPKLNPSTTGPKYLKWAGYLLLILLVSYLLWPKNFMLQLAAFDVHNLGRFFDLAEILHVSFLGLITGFKVMVLIFISSLIWVPFGVWVGSHPRISQYIQPLVQFFASFPANLLYPVVVLAILKFNLSVEIWTSPLMILGTQWYILFNVIAGASAIPKELKYAVSNFGVKRWLWWKRMALPAIFPYFITGAMTAAGGAWNASIIAEVVSWKSTTLQATGLGAYIMQSAQAGDFYHLFLGIIVMSCYVILINRLLWHRLYQLAETRFHL